MTSTALLKAEKKARDERAWEAVKVFRRMLPSLTSFARALTHNPRIRVVMGARAETDGNVISICPPIKLGDKIPHVRRDCGLRDKNYVPVCLACSTEEEIFVNCIHEIAHIVGLSFERTTPEDRTLALTKALQESSDALAERVRQKFNLAPERTRGDYMGLASLVSDFLPPLYNQLEDIRIDNHMFEARKGTKKMYKGDVWKIYNERREGFKLPKELPLNTQMVLGLWIEACEYDYDGWLHPQVEGHLKDPELQNLLWRVANARNAAAVWTLVFPVLECLRKLGYMLSPEERDEQQQQMEQEQEPDSESEEEPSSMADSDESQSGADSSEAESEFADQGEPTPDMGGDPEDGSQDQEGETSDDDGVPDSAGEDSESTGEQEHADSSQSETEDSQDAEGDQQDQQGGDGDEGLSDVEEWGDGRQDENLHESSEGAVDDTPESSGDMDQASGQAEDAEGSFSDTEGSQGSSDGDGEEASSEGQGNREGDPRDGRDDSDSSGDSRQDNEADDFSESLDSGDSLDSDSSGWSPDDLAPPGDEQGGMVSTSTDGDSTDLEASDSNDNAPGESSSESDEEGGESGPIDSGVYRDDGAVQAPAPDYGDAEGLQEAIDTVHKHGQPHVIGTENTKEEDKSVAKAIIQSMYFETSSEQVAGVREHYGDKHVIASNGSDESIGFTREIKCDMEIPNGVLNPLLLKMKRMFRNNRISSFDADRKSGHVDPRVLGQRAWDKSDGRLFGKLREPEEKDYFVIIAGDISGSQMGVSLSLTKRAMKAQALLCHRAKVPFAIYAHSMVHSADAGGMTLEVYVIKDVDDRWTTATEELLDNLAHVAGNLDGHAVEYFRRKIDKIPAQERIIMYYTDGKMPAANHDEELEILQREIRTCKRKNIHLMGVGIRTDSPIRHGLDTVQVDTDEDLVKVVYHLGKMLT